MRLGVTKRDGTAPKISVTAATTRVRLYQESDVASVDLRGIGVAKKLAIFETGQHDAIAWTGLDELAALPALTNLTLCVDEGTDLSPLGHAAMLAHLSLYVHGRTTWSASWLGRLRTLESLSLSFAGGKPLVDLGELPPSVRSLSLSGVGNAVLDVPPFESFNATDCDALRALEVDGSKLAYLHVMQCRALERLDVLHVGASLENVHLTGLDALRELDLPRLASGGALKRFTLVNHGVASVDVTPLMGLASLVHVSIDGKNAPFFDRSCAIKSPALRALNDAGRLEPQ